MNQGRETFGPWLRSQRERTGVSLDTIANNTKIKKSLLEALERNDLSQWPAAGIFRRAYVRDYATAIGLSADLVLADFVRVFPQTEDGPPSPPRGAAHAEPVEADRLVLTFADGFNWRAGRATTRTMSAAADLTGVLLLGMLLAVTAGVSFWTGSGILALVYYPLMQTWRGETLAAQYFRNRGYQRKPSPVVPPADFTVRRSDTQGRTIPETERSTPEPALEELADPLLLAANPAPPTDTAREAAIH